MCASCGCSASNRITITDAQSGKHFHLGSSEEHTHGHRHTHSHDVFKLDLRKHGHEHRHSHSPHPTHAQLRTITLEQEILSRNNQLAERNRGWLSGRQVVAVNMMSSPGAGKTTLLERTIRELGTELGIHVIEGDQETLNDAERIRSTGARVVQVNTGTGCHLDAEMLASALKKLDPPPGSSVIIENVGNLVCPALFDLGEQARVVIASVTEGHDKPEKYPHMFRSADVIVLNKMDLLPYVDFSVDCFTQKAKNMNAEIRILPVSATRGDGLKAWYEWLRDLQARRRHE